VRAPTVTPEALIVALNDENPRLRLVGSDTEPSLPSSLLDPDVANHPDPWRASRSFGTPTPSDLLTVDPTGLVVHS